MPRRLAEDVVREHRRDLWNRAKEAIAANIPLATDPAERAELEQAGPELFKALNDMNDRDVFMSWAKRNPNQAKDVVGWESFEKPSVMSGAKKGIGGMLGGAVGRGLNMLPDWATVGPEVDYTLGQEAVAPGRELVGALGGRLVGEGTALALTGGASLPLRAGLYGAASGGFSPWTDSDTRLEEGTKGIGGKIAQTIPNAIAQGVGYAVPMHNASYALGAGLNVGQMLVEDKLRDWQRGTSHASVPFAIGTGLAMGVPIRGIAAWKGVPATNTLGGVAKGAISGAWQGVRHPVTSAQTLRTNFSTKAIPAMRATFTRGATPESVAEAVQAGQPIPSHAQPSDVFVHPKRTPEEEAKLWNSLPPEDQELARANGFGPSELADLFSVAANKRVEDVMEVLDPRQMGKAFKRFGNQTRAIVTIDGKPVEGRIVGMWDPDTKAGRDLGDKGRFVFHANGTLYKLNAGQMADSTRWMPIGATNAAVRLDPGWQPVARWGETVPAPAEGIAIAARHPEGKLLVVKADDPTKSRIITDPREVGLDADWFEQERLRKEAEMLAKEEAQKQLQEEMALGHAQTGSKPNQKIPTLGQLQEDALARMRAAGRRGQEFVHTGYREQTGAEPPSGFPGIPPAMPGGPFQTSTPFPLAVSHGPAAAPPMRPQPAHAQPVSPNRPRNAAIRKLITEATDISDPAVLAALLRALDEGR